jgi:hypothetical protein
MNLAHLDLIPFLKIAAGGQMVVAVLNLFLVKEMKWREPLNQLPLLAREVFYVHSLFITVILLSFGVLTLRFVEPMARGHNEALAWLAGAIGIFWGIRTFIQIFYYSSSHWRGQPGRIGIHIFLLLAYGGASITYLIAAVRTPIEG